MPDLLDKVFGRETSTDLLDDVFRTSPVFDPAEEDRRIKDTLDISEKSNVPIESATQSHETFQSIQTKHDKAAKATDPFEFPGFGGFSQESVRALIPHVPVRPVKTAGEIAKGLVRFTENIAGTVGGTAQNWLGQFIEHGGKALDDFTKLGSKNKDQIYNPYAEAIMAFGRERAQIGRESRRWWSFQAQTGWEALDPQLKETDPISYGAGRLTEGVASSGLSVLAVYLSGGAAAPALLDKGIQINRGLLALSGLSAAGGFEHAQSTGENFLWSTAAGLADGTIEYAMESTFLQGVGKGKGALTAGFKEGGEEFVTGMLQNTRASMLENEKKGLSTYESAKDAIVKSLKQSPWEVAAGFIGGYGMQGGANLTAIVNTWKTTPVEAPVVSGKVQEVVEAPVKAKTPAKPTITPKAEVTAPAAEEGKKAFHEMDRAEQLEEIEVLKKKPIQELSLADYRDLHAKRFQPGASEFARGYTKSRASIDADYRKAIKAAQAQPAPAAKPKERDILGGVEPIFQINKALKEAVEIRPKVEKERKAELRKRVGAAAGALKSSLTKRKISAEESIGRSTGLLKGPLSNARFTSIRDVMEDAMPGAVDTAFRSIGESETLKYFEIIETKEAFSKLIDGIPITLREVDMIKRHFGIEMGEIAKSRAEKSSFADRLWNFWRAGLLTGLKTSGLNVMSTSIHSMTEIGTDLIAAPVDVVTSLFTGKRTVGLALTGDAKAFKEGAVKGWEYLWTGVSERDIGKKFDYVPINYGNSTRGKAVQIYVGFTFRAMGAQDQPFFYGAMSRSIKSQAIAEAKTVGEVKTKEGTISIRKPLKGKELTDFVAKRRLSPSGEMLENATHDAEQAVFQNRTLLGDVASKIQKVPGIRWTVPFSRTPSAVAMQIINYSPAGGFIEVLKQIKKGEFNQRDFSHAVGRSVVSTPILAAGALLLAKGLMTLDYPDSERERKLWELEGKKPFAIKVGDKWRSVFVLGPAGNVLAIGAYFQKALTESGSPSEAIVTAMAGGGKSFTEQTFVVGMSKAIDAIKDPDRSFDRFFTGMAGSFVPTILADVARASDYGERTYRGPWQGIVNRVPIARTTLEERVDVFGQALPRYGGNPLEVMIDASRPVKIRQDVVVDEIRRLWDKNVRVAPTQLGNRDGYKSLTQKENVLLWRRAGEATYQSLFELIQRGSYKKKGDEAKGKMVERVVKDAKDDARAEAAAIKLNQGMTMKELKESGLVTIDVEPLIRRKR